MVGTRRSRRLTTQKQSPNENKNESANSQEKEHKSGSISNCEAPEGIAKKDFKEGTFQDDQNEAVEEKPIIKTEFIAASEEQVQHFQYDSDSDVQIVPAFSHHEVILITDESDEEAVTDHGTSLGGDESQNEETPQHEDHTQTLSNENGSEEKLIATSDSSLLKVSVDQPSQFLSDPQTPKAAEPNSGTETELNGTEPQMVLQASRYYPNIHRDLWFDLDISHDSEGVSQYFSEEEKTEIRTKLANGFSLHDAQEFVKNRRKENQEDQTLKQAEDLEEMDKAKQLDTEINENSLSEFDNAKVNKMTESEGTILENRDTTVHIDIDMDTDIDIEAESVDGNIFEATKDDILQASRYYPNLDYEVWGDLDFTKNHEGIPEFYTKKEKMLIQAKLFEGLSLHDSQEFAKGFRTNKRKTRISLINEQIVQRLFKKSDSIEDLTVDLTSIPSDLDDSEESSNEENEKQGEISIQEDETNIFSSKRKSNLSDFIKKKEKAQINSALHGGATRAETLQASRYYSFIDKKIWSSLDLSRNAEGLSELYTSKELNVIRIQLSAGLSLHDSQEYVKNIRKENYCNDENRFIAYKKHDTSTAVLEGFRSLANESDRSLGNLPRLEFFELFPSERIRKEMILQSSRFYPNLERRIWMDLDVTRNSDGLFEYYNDKELGLIRFRLDQGLSLESAQQIVKNRRKVEEKKRKESMNAYENKKETKLDETKTKPKSLEKRDIQSKEENTVTRGKKGREQEIEKESNSSMRTRSKTSIPSLMSLSINISKEIDNENDVLIKPTKDAILQASRYYENLRPEIWSELNVKRNAKGFSEYYTDEEEKRIRFRLGQGLSLESAQEIVKNARSSEEKRRIARINSQIQKGESTSSTLLHTNLRIEKETAGTANADAAADTSVVVRKSLPTITKLSPGTVSKAPQKPEIAPKMIQNEVAMLPRQDRLLQERRFNPYLSREFWDDVDITRNSKGELEFYTAEEQKTIRHRLQQGLCLDSAQKLVKNKRTYYEKKRIDLINYQRQLQRKRKSNVVADAEDVNTKYRKPNYPTSDGSTPMPKTVPKIAKLGFSPSNQPNSDSRISNTFQSRPLKTANVSNDDQNTSKTVSATLTYRDAVLQRKRYTPNLPREIWSDLNITRNADGIFEYYTEKEMKVIRFRLDQGLSLESAQEIVKNARKVEEKKRIGLLNSQKQNKHDQSAQDEMLKKDIANTPSANKQKEASVTEPSNKTGSQNNVVDKKSSISSEPQLATDSSTNTINKNVAIDALPYRDKVLHKSRNQPNLRQYVWTGLDLTRNSEGVSEFYTEEEKELIELRLVRGLSLESAQELVKNARSAKEKKRIDLINNPSKKEYEKQSCKSDTETTQPMKGPSADQLNVVTKENTATETIQNSATETITTPGAAQSKSLVTPPTSNKVWYNPNYAVQASDISPRKAPYAANQISPPNQLLSTYNFDVKNITINAEGQREYYTKEEKKYIFKKLQKGLDLHVAQSIVKKRRSPMEAKRIAEISKQWPPRPPKRMQTMETYSNRPDQTKISDDSQKDLAIIDVAINSDGKREYFTDEEKRYIRQQIEIGSMTLHQAQEFVRKRRTAKDDNQQQSPVEQKRPKGPPETPSASKVYSINVIGTNNPYEKPSTPAMNVTPVRPVMNRIPYPASMNRAPAPHILNRAPAPHILNRAPVAPIMNRAPVAPVMNRAPVAPIMNRAPVAPIMNRAPVAPNMNRAPVRPRAPAPVHMQNRGPAPAQMQHRGPAPPISNRAPVPNQTINNPNLISIQTSSGHMVNASQNNSAMVHHVNTSGYSGMDRNKAQQMGFVNQQTPYQSPQKAKSIKIVLQNPPGSVDNQDSRSKIPANNCHYSVAIVSGKYPSKNLSNVDIEEIKRRLLFEIDNAESLNDNLGFHDCKSQSGQLLLTCNNEETKNWLSKIIETLQPFPRGYLKVIEQNEMSSYLCYTYVPKGDVMPFSQLQLRLQKQNSGLSTTNWKVLNTCTTFDGGQNLLLSIDESSKERIIAQNGKLFLNFAQIEVRLKDSSGTTEIPISSGMSSLPVQQPHNNQQQWNSAAPSKQPANQQQAPPISNTLNQSKHRIAAWCNDVKMSIGIQPSANAATTQSVGVDDNDKDNDMDSFVPPPPEPPKISTMLQPVDHDSSFSIDLTDEDIDMLLAPPDPPQITGVVPRDGNYGSDKRVGQQGKQNPYAKNIPITPPEPPKLSSFLEKHMYPYDKNDSMPSTSRNTTAARSHTHGYYESQQPDGRSTVGDRTNAHSNVSHYVRDNITDNRRSNQYDEPDYRSTSSKDLPSSILRSYYTNR